MRRSGASCGKLAGGGRVLGESVLMESDNVGENGFTRFLSSQEPTPEDASQVAEEFDRLLNKLDDPVLRMIALGKLEGRTSEEIAEQIGTLVRTVDRKLRLIRSGGGGPSMSSEAGEGRAGGRATSPPRTSCGSTRFATNSKPGGRRARHPNLLRPWFSPLFRGPARSELLRELLAIELEVRVALGQRVDGARYASLFPDDLDTVEEVLTEAGCAGGSASSLPDRRRSLGTAARRGDELRGSSVRRVAAQLNPAAMTALEAAGYEVLGELGRGGMGVVYLAKKVSSTDRAPFKTDSRAPTRGRWPRSGSGRRPRRSPDSGTRRSFRSTTSERRKVFPFSNSNTFQEAAWPRHAMARHAPVRGGASFRPSRERLPNSPPGDRAP